jgi:hypothetical protein
MALLQFLLDGLDTSAEAFSTLVINEVFQLQGA